MASDVNYYQTERYNDFYGSGLVELLTDLLEGELMVEVFFMTHAAADLIEDTDEIMIELGDAPETITALVVRLEELKAAAFEQAPLAHAQDYARLMDCLITMILEARRRELADGPEEHKATCVCDRCFLDKRIAAQDEAAEALVKLTATSEGPPETVTSEGLPETVTSEGLPETAGSVPALPDSQKG